MKIAIFHSIRTKIFASHLLLILVIIASLTYQHHKNEINNTVSMTTAFHQEAAIPLISDISTAISGGNYSNLLLPKFKTQLMNTPDLLYLKIVGRSDNRSIPIEVQFDREVCQVWRSHFPLNFQQNTKDRIERIQARLATNEGDNVKLNYLLNRAKEALNTFELSNQLEAKYHFDFDNNNEFNTSYFDREKNILFLSLPTTNSAGGRVDMVYDISSIKKVEHVILFDALSELFVALAIALPALGLLSFHISAPLKSLSKCMKRDIKDIDTTKIPEQNRHDEIGELSTEFTHLIKKMAIHTKELEYLTRNDPLTGLLNRRSFNSLLAEIQVKNRSKYIAIMYVDIDHFKKYNDTYGHNLGDIALQKVAQVLSDNTVDENEKAFRVGGEEFVVTLNISNLEQAITRSEKIRKMVHELEIEHKTSPTEKVITISAGVCIYTKQDLLNTTIEDVVDYVDHVQYQAKHNGRNQIIICDKYISNQTNRSNFAQLENNYHDDGLPPTHP
ncbi:GGDEF domain-containing protein [Vibrio genomosp. F6]|uniref:GGDEF domain-containing protein n=1 Tax=Vibrio genomosp. F6 TaxID=723172 RepID=UPI0010BD0C6E|nr:GGDEF domain-containing protein [Vibrio genomosp. F6]TKF22033.1 GGDEF domain-containing protein [Vibrio genomosp. F6]